MVKGPFAVSRILLVLSLVGLIGLSFLLIRALEEDVEAYRGTNQEAIHWSSAQVEVELSRFTGALARFAHGEPGVTADDVRERFDLVWSRTGLFRSGQIGERLREYDGDLGTIPLVLAKLQFHETAIVNVTDNSKEENLAIARSFAELHAPLRQLSVRVLSGEEARYAGVRKNLMSSSELTFWVWAATLALAAAIIGVMFNESRRYRRMIADKAKLAEEAQAANRAKSRFLTMMSHELRTPMNGVMGLMALAKQSGLTDRQTRLISQAERSGTQMAELLNDILDYSDLQVERLTIEKTPFQPKELARDIDRLLEEPRKRHSLKTSVEVGPQMPEWVIGDFPRLRQAILHFCNYLIEIVGARDLHIVMVHDGRRLVIELDVDSRAPGTPGWQPEAIFGHQETDYGEFASDSVGPMIARGLVEMMDGAVRMRRLVSDRASLFVNLPAEEVEPVHDCIRIEVLSDTTRLVIDSALSETGFRVWTPQISIARVAAVVIEESMDAELGMVMEMRNQHPGARIVAIGTPARAID